MNVPTHLTAVLAVVAAAALAACGGEASSTGGASASAATSAKPATSVVTSAKPTASAATPAPSASAAAAPATGAIGKLQEDLQANPDNYKDKPVKLEGLYMSTSKATSGGKTTYTVSVTDAKGDLDHTIGCDLGETAPPENMMQYVPVAIEGKGRVSNASKGGKEFKSISVAECKLTLKEEPKKDEPKKEEPKK